MPETKQKNRRYRGAKISEHRLKRVVECFARKKTIAETVKETKLSEPTVTALFWRLREHLQRYPMFNFQIAPADTGGTKEFFDKRFRGGQTPEKLVLHGIELVTRAVAATRYTYVERLKASNPKDMERARALYKSNKAVPRYNMTEMLKPGTPDELKEENMRPFDPGDYETTSVILVNEQKIDADGAFFRYLWDLLLKHPL